MRAAIAAASGVEVLFIGDVEDGVVVEVTVAARGREHEVVALLERPRAGQVVIHNHPSGDLRPSDPDQRLASLYGEDGVGMVIVDSAVTRDRWVVEPWGDGPRAVPADELTAILVERLPQVFPGWEVRDAQRGMAEAVADALSAASPLVCEAGTGTGKSLAYLLPAALWAVANDQKVVVSTFTRSLQAQLLADDIPVLPRVGMELRVAVLQGRANYLCKRRLGLAIEAAEDADRQVLDDLSRWEQTSAHGSRADLPFQVDRDLWDAVASDADLSLGHRCPHYDTCHYYRARRRAAAAHVIVVNHALLLVDLSLRAELGRGVLPRYDRLVLDEAHHLEGAATGAVSQQLSALAIRRASRRLLAGRRRRGALDGLFSIVQPKLDTDRGDELARRIVTARDHLGTLPDTANAILEQVLDAAVPDGRTPLRLTAEVTDGPRWREAIAPALIELGTALAAAVGALHQVLELVDEVELTPEEAQPGLEVRRAARRLAGHTEVLRSFFRRDDVWCRWVEPARGRRERGRAQVSIAPIDLAPVLRRILWEPLPGTAATSATMTTGGTFDWWCQRTGLSEVRTEVFPSPFDHASQALLGLPRDLPPPDAPGYLERTAEILVDAVRVSGGGAFVLCTSYKAVDAYAEALRRGLDGTTPVLVQGKAARPVLMERFREHGDAVLVGTDSFWEGVSVKGNALRLVVIPRLPFRVPTEPLQLARQEALQRQGLDPFRAYSLPQAILKLKQGYGRLIRSRTDRGAVLFLDRRLHERRYGRVMLASMPPARQVRGPWRRVRAALEELYASF